MSEAQRWKVKNTLPNSDGGTPFIRPEVVLAADFDRVTADRDAALADAALWRSRCGAKCYEVDTLQQRLTAADERADVLEGLLREVEAACDLAMSAIDDDERGANFVQIIAAIKAKAVPKRSDELVAQHAAIDFFDDALKPADGFLGSTCNEVREEAGLPINRPCKACNGSACIDR